MDNVRDIFEKINIQGRILFREPMKYHTTFKVGGPADVFIIPKTVEDIISVLHAAASLTIPFFPLGGGANILVSQQGIRGIVLDMSSFTAFHRTEEHLSVIDAGFSVSEAAAMTANLGYTGLETFYAMPGSLGGSIFMNARCYGHSISDTLQWVEVITPGDSAAVRVSLRKNDFSYKSSPFQNKKTVIIRGAFRLIPGDKDELLRTMANVKKDRISKGHFQYPSGGSIFKNNRQFGKPTGKIIDELGLRGVHIGGCRVSDLHANIIVNTGNATADDIKKLIEFIEQRVYKERGIKLEREIILAGEWTDEGGV